ncbi:MAG: tRNA uridine-5-carboxymethylaminomethyl(34) synthesis GTPase MnmE [Pseudomonadota bacterium]
MEKMKADTIAAIATPVGTGGIGIVRISGPNAHAIAEKIFLKRKRSSFSSYEASTMMHGTFEKRMIYFGNVIDPAKKTAVDEVLLVVMSAPHSYTCEDVVEIQAHASTAGLKMILELVLTCGARIAEPGEFTKRAFLNGRIDLTQAEAVLDVVTARTEKALRLANTQLCGGLGEEIGRIAWELKRILVEVEAAIDFSEDTEDIVESEIRIEKFQENVIAPIQKLLKNYDDGHLYREGLRLVIVGRPNVGKSSLMNRLLKMERAIVTPVPGTTRDSIEESLNIHGVAVLLADTAGIHDSTDPLEIIGMQRTEKIAREADLILFVIEAAAGVTAEDGEIYEKVKEKPIILVINKIDLENGKKKTEVPEKWQLKGTVRTSVLFDEGMERLKEKIYENSFGATEEDEGWLVPNLRQKEMIEKSYSAAKTAESGIKRDISLELVAIDLREAISALNQVVGKDPRIEILDEIFSRFCVGK